MPMAAALLDALLCPEDPFIDDGDDQELNEPNQALPVSDSTELLASLIAGDRKAPTFDLIFTSPNDPYLPSARGEAIHWIKTTSSRFGFNALTVILAVNYLDRCFLCSAAGLRLQHDKPWMKQLSAVACLALAAKVEETHVPFLLDLQIPTVDEVTGVVFEPKMIRRMELLVLSTLSWRMNPVTALSFTQCILPMWKGGDQNSNVVEILRSCERILLSAVADWRWVKFSPSVWAAASLLQAVGQQRHCDQMQHIFDLLQVSKERVEECHCLIVELVGVGNNKRKSCCNYSEPASPSCVICSCFSYENSSSSSSLSSSLDSWTVLPSSVSSSPEQPPPFKRPNCPFI